MARRKTYPNGSRKAAPKRRRHTKRSGPLAEWLKSSAWTAGAMATELGISIQHMSNLLHGRSRPSVDVQAQIERLSSGVVTSASWGAK